MRKYLDRIVYWILDSRLGHWYIGLLAQQEFEHDEEIKKSKEEERHEEFERIHKIRRKGFEIEE